MGPSWGANKLQSQFLSSPSTIQRRHSKNNFDPRTRNQQSSTLMDTNECKSPPRKPKVARKIRHNSGKSNSKSGSKTYAAAGSAAEEEREHPQVVSQATLAAASSRNSIRESESEYNLACSSNSSPEHKIHTVVVGAHSSKFPKTSDSPATTSQGGCQSEGAARLKMPSAYQPEAVPLAESDYSPDPPSTIISDSGVHLSSKVVSKDSSPSFDIAAYTNGNMAEIIDSDGHIDPEKAEFMYGFEGAMSVIQETEEPDDDMTRKSSSMQIVARGSQSFAATPLSHHQNRDSGVFAKKHIFNDYSMISPAAVMSRVLAQTVSQRKAESLQTSEHQPRNLLQKAPKKISQPNTSISVFEDSQQFGTMDSLDDTNKPAIQMVISNSSSVTQFKSMQSCGGAMDPSKKSQLLELTNNLGTPKKASRQHKKPILSPKANKIVSPRESPPHSERKKSSSEKKKQKKKNGLQLSEYLARQTEKLLNRQSPKQPEIALALPTGTEQLETAGPMKKCQSPVRPSQPQNLSNVISLKNTEICKKEKEESIQHQFYAQPSQLVITEECCQSSVSRKQSASNHAAVIEINSSRSREEQMSPQQSQSPQKPPKRTIVLAPPHPQTQDLQESEQQNFGQRLQGLNMNIVSLRDDIKERQMYIYKEVKALKAKVQLPTAILEEKLDADFMERALTVYAFFTSCLNMILLNDQEAHKLQLLQPLIEKHITELKLDELAIQANPIDTFEINNDTLSSISPSFNTSYNSPGNETILNHMQLLRKSPSVTPSRKTSIICRGMSVAQKLNLLKMLLQIADQVLSLNSLKHRLIIDNKVQSKPVSSLPSHESLFSNPMTQQSLQPSQQSSKMAIAPLFISENFLSEGSGSREQTNRDRNSCCETSRLRDNSQNDSVTPDRRKPLSPASQRQDIYYSREKGKSTLQQKDATLAGSTRLEDQYSTLTSSKGFSPQTVSLNHRRNLSDGQVAVNDGGPNPRANHQGLPVKHQNQKRWTSEQDESYFQQQAADTYFRTTTSGSPGDAEQSSRRQEQTVTTNGLINLEQVAKDYQQSQSLVTGMAYGGNSLMVDRATSDSSKHPNAVLYASKRSGRDDSFGVASSSARSASRNVHQPQHEMQNQQKSLHSPTTAKLEQKKSSIMSIKDTSDSFMTAMASQKAKGPSIGWEKDKNCNNSWVTGKTQIFAEQPSNQRKNSYQQLHSVRVEMDQSGYASPKHQTRISDLPDSSSQNELACGTVELDNHGKVVQQLSGGKDMKSPKQSKTDRARKLKQVNEFLTDGGSSARSRAMYSLKEKTTSSVKKGKTVSMSPPVEPEPTLSPKPQYFSMMRQTLKAEMMKRSKTNKAESVTARNQSETLSDVSGMSQSRNTMDQFSAAGRNSEKSNQTRGSKGANNSTSKRKKKGATTTSSYLASFNCSSSQNETAKVISKKQTTVAGESKVRKALKGVIVAQQQQQQFAPSINHSQSQKQFMNISSNSNHHVSHLHSPREGLQQPSKAAKTKRDHHLQKSSSAKLNVLSQANQQSVMVVQAPSHQKITRMGSQATLSPKGQRPQKDLMSPSGSTAKRMQVTTGNKLSNFLLRQQICVNTDKLGLSGVAVQGHNQTQQSTQTVRKNRSPQSLSQAFSAVARAISKRTTKTNQPGGTAAGGAQKVMPLKTKGSFQQTTK